LSIFKETLKIIIDNANNYEMYFMEIIMKLIKTILILFTISGFQAVFAEGKDVFKKKCGVCHSMKSVSTGKMGPDLTGYASKRPEEYLQMYMKDPKTAKAKFSEIFKKEVEGKYKSTMPAIKVTDDEIAAILSALK
jgi:mono/diheme cytochrome c family protein